MTVHTSEHATDTDRAGVTALGNVMALPRTVRIIGGAGIAIGGLLAVGVPLATLTPLIFLGGCLGMHLFMGHGMSHGGGHSRPTTILAWESPMPSHHVFASRALLPDGWASDVLLDRRNFHLDESDFRAVLAQLDRPPSRKLIALLKSKPVWET